MLSIYSYWPTTDYIRVDYYLQREFPTRYVLDLELCTPSHSSKCELFNCPNVISQQSTIYSYVHHHIPQSASFSIVQTSYLNNPQFRVMYTITFLKVRAFQLSKRHISTIHNSELCTPSHSSKYELFNCPNVISQQSTI